MFGLRPQKDNIINIKRGEGAPNFGIAPDDMNLTDRLEQDMKTALKQKEKRKLSVIRMVRAAIKKEEIDQKRSLEESEVLQILNRELKQRNESLHEFQKAGREELVQQQEEEIAILKTYLPEQLREEKHELVRQVIAEVQAESKADIGKVMRAIMPRLEGRADGKRVNQMVQHYLQ